MGMSMPANPGQGEGQEGKVIIKGMRGEPAVVSGSNSRVYRKTLIICALPIPDFFPGHDWPRL